MRVETAHLFPHESKVLPRSQTFSEHQARVAAREKILRLLCEKPMRWAEMQNALGLLHTREAHFACEWLMDHGYIAPMKLAHEATRSADALWTLGDRGRVWALRNGALAGEDARLRN